MNLFAILRGRWCSSHKQEHEQVYVAGLGQSVLMCKVCAASGSRWKDGRLQELKELYERTDKYTVVWIPTRDVGILLDRIQALEYNTICCDGAPHHPNELCRNASDDKHSVAQRLFFKLQKDLKERGVLVDEVLPSTQKALEEDWIALFMKELR